MAHPIAPFFFRKQKSTIAAGTGICAYAKLSRFFLTEAVGVDGCDD